MCGISCCVTLHGSKCISRSELKQQLETSLDIIKHRGPDSRGYWISDNSRIALGHVRLSINDLSPSGAQPFHSPDGTIHAVINGELYGYDDIRAELQSHADFQYQFQGSSDSEIVIPLYQYYGLNFLDHLRGEFSLCLWDENEQFFVAARDRYGIKPLFYTTDKGCRLLVAAEVKAFLGMGWTPEWDVRSIKDCGWTFDNRTDFAGVRKIRPGHYILCRLHAHGFEERAYWDPDYSDKEPRSEQEMIEGVRERLVEAVRLRLRADVPVGVYLSGGIDSSAVAGIMTHLIRERGEKLGNKHETDRVSCFSIAFDKESGFDESDVAKRTAKFLNVEYHQKYMSESEVASRFEEAAWHCEHVSADIGFVGKFALSELPPALGFKVVLTGEGSDEHFAGYPVFLPDYLREPDPSWPQSAQLTEAERETLCEAKDKIAAFFWNSMGADGSIYGSEASALPRRMLNGTTTPPSLSAFSPASLFAPWTSQLGKSNPRLTVANSYSGQVRSSMMHKWHPLHTAMYSWTKGLLANYFLASLGDRTEMAHSLEGRTPFLDHVLTSYVNGLPPSVKLRYRTIEGENGSPAPDFVEKWILREAVKPFVTEEIYSRKKQPYLAPVTYKVDGPLHELFRRLIIRENVEQLGFVDWEKAKTLVGDAFEKKNNRAMRFCFILGQWIAIGKWFGIPPAKVDAYNAL